VAGDPNVVRPAGVDDVGRVAVNTVSGGIFQARYVALMSGTDTITLPTIGLTNGISVFGSSRIVTLMGGSSEVTRYKRSDASEFGLVERTELTGQGLFWLQRPGAGIVFVFSGLQIPVLGNGSYKNYAATLGPASANALANFNGTPLIGPSQVNTIATGQSIGGGAGVNEYHYFALCDRESTQAQLNAFVATGVLPCEPKLIFSPSRMFPGAGPTFPNPGSAGGNFTISDGSPVTIQSVAWVPYHIPI
jgi:hypothetical protein